MKVIILSNGFECYVDDSDYEELSKYKWHFDGRSYAFRNVRDSKIKTQRMHKFITNTDSNSDVDHINRNGLDNRRSNLRICSQSQNNANIRTRNLNGYKNIRYDFNRKSKWFRVSITKNKKSYYGGNFKKLSDAVECAIKLGKELYGEFYAYKEFDEKDEVVLD